jgi:hypothetical protein
VTISKASTVSGPKPSCACYERAIFSDQDRQESRTQQAKSVDDQQKLSESSAFSLTVIGVGVSVGARRFRAVQRVTDVHRGTHPHRGASSPHVLLCRPLACTTYQFAVPANDRTDFDPTVGTTRATSLRSRSNGEFVYVRNAGALRKETMRRRRASVPIA